MSLFASQGTVASSGSTVVKTTNTSAGGIGGYLQFNSGSTTSSGGSGEIKNGTGIQL